MTGQIFDRGGSPNDPVFIVHHTMIDCMFDEWMQRYPDQRYPDDVPLTISTQGHQAHSYMVPFFPVYTNADMFKLAASNFGYYCNLTNLTTATDTTNTTNTTNTTVTPTTESGGFPQVQLTLLTWLSVIFITLVLLY